jgi:hypothetical protein
MTNTANILSATTDPDALWTRWFGSALTLLEKLPHGDGGMAGLMVVLPLYERYIHILIDDMPSTCVTSFVYNVQHETSWPVLAEKIINKHLD